MEMIRRMEPVVMLLVIIGAINWGLVGLFDTNLVSDIFGTGTVTDVIYVLVGIAGLLLIPRLLEGLHMGTHEPHPHGT